MGGDPECACMRHSGRYQWEVDIVPVKRHLGSVVVIVVVGVIVGGCGATGEQRGGPGVDGPVVAGQCAEGISGCDDTVGASGPVTTTGSDTTTTTGGTPTSVVSATTSATELQSIVVAFTADGGECDEVILLDRHVDASLDAITAAFESLVAGPTEEELASGAQSFFSADTAGTELSVTYDDETLVVTFGDLRSVIPNASTTCGSMSLLAQLNATTFQFDRVERVRYEMEQSCDTFSNWLQRDCTEYTRDGAYSPTQ